jgi:formylglycine-generating enzyme required for sulfatase activity
VLVALGLLVLAACAEDVRVEPVAGQIVLYVDTDAPVPDLGTKAEGPMDVAPLFDRVRIDVYAPDAATPCSGCTNEFAIDADAFRERRISVGLVPPPGASGYRARVRMFLSELRAPDGSPFADATVEVVVALPVVEGKEKRELTAFLATDLVGVPDTSLEAPAAPALGAPARSLVGTWPPAARIPCAEAPRPGEVCIPGGAFWMGKTGEPWAILPQSDVNAPRLVVLSPFFLDATEVTVARFRDGGGVTNAWSGGSTGADLFDFCTFTQTPGARDDYPVVCIAVELARGHCRGRGADLPSEAQYEWVASGLRGHSYVWGEDPPSCADAVFARTGYGILAESQAQCRPPEAPGGPLPAGRGMRDRLVLPTGTVLDIAGNAKEWCVDRWNRADEACWAAPGIYVDPVCNNPTTRDGTLLRAARGGDWVVSGRRLVRTARGAASGSSFFASPQVGFRCARSSAAP